MNILRFGQTDLMLVMSGVCLMILVITLLTKFDIRQVKFSLLIMELCSFLLLRANRLSLLYAGDTSTLGFTMTRFSNFAVTLFLLLELAAFNAFLAGFLTENEKLTGASRGLYLSKILLLAAAVMLALNPATGLLFRLDEANLYVRGPGFLLCNVLFFAVLLMQMTVIIQCRTRLRPRIRYAVLAYTILTIAAAIIQYFIRSMSLNTFSFACLSLVLHMCAVYDGNRKLAESRQRELEISRAKEEQLRTILGETAGALAGAIDAKDTYTNGHSRRVAEYAREIARRAGKSEEDCSRVYFAGLLHDVGKIGIPDEIINKPGRLTDEEFDIIKTHPVIGARILENIKELPYLRLGALDHHERYDGRGYPNHIAGEEIPEPARIIAVADSYDAMTSNRSYRSLIPQADVRAEIEKGRGTQFDPQFADCMLQMIDEDVNYELHEK